MELAIYEVFPQPVSQLLMHLFKLADVWVVYFIVKVIHFNQGGKFLLFFQINLWLLPHTLFLSSSLGPEFAFFNWLQYRIVFSLSVQWELKSLSEGYVDKAHFALHFLQQLGCVNEGVVDGLLGFDLGDVGIVQPIYYVPYWSQVVVVLPVFCDVLLFILLVHYVVEIWLERVIGWEDQVRQGLFETLVFVVNHQEGHLLDLVLGNYLVGGVIYPIRWDQFLLEITAHGLHDICFTERLLLVDSWGAFAGSPSKCYSALISVERSSAMRWLIAGELPSPAVVETRLTRSIQKMLVWVCCFGLRWLRGRSSWVSDQL